jgi:RHS repeat-associated protein
MASLLGPMAAATAAPGTAAATAATRNPLVDLTSTPVKYTYDAAGRLASVTDAAGERATYKYDAEGNLTSITHSAASARSGPTVTARPPGQPAPTIESVTPIAQSSGGLVTIEGQGFSASASADVVRIGNLFAPVRHASSDRLVVTAPPNTGGTVTVLTPGGSASGPRVKVIEPRSPRPLRPGVNRRPLRAGPGVTALSGEVERPGGKPLAGVLLTLTTISGKVRARTMTNRAGRFLLSRVDSGRAELIINGNHVAGDSRYGLYAEPVQLPAGRTTVLPWITYLTALDETHAITIASPTTHPISLTSPRIPGLIVQIPKGTVIHDYYGRVVHRISLTPLAVGRTPFPWAPGMVPQYFSLQPGDSTVSGPGLRVIYPNDSNQPPGSAIPYLVDSPNWGGTGWWRYGTGHVTANGKEIVPDARTVYRRLLPGGYPSLLPPGLFPAPGAACGCGDPVDPSTGLFIYNQTDLSIPDVNGVTFSRTFRQLDDTVRDFGIGMSDSLNLYISVNANGDFDLVLPDGSEVAYAPTGTTGVYDAVGSPTAFVGSTLTMGSGDPDGPFTVSLTDGTVMSFGNPSYLTKVTDMYGNTLTINRIEYTYTQNGGGEIQSVVTPNGQWMKFTYGVCVPGSTPSYCVTQVEDNLGRTYIYAYDAHGRLVTVTDPDGGVTTYGWAACTSAVTCTELLTVTDPDHHTVVTNTYDPSTGLVTAQTNGDGAKWSYKYVLSSDNQVTEADVTGPDGATETLDFASGYPSSTVVAAGTKQAETTTTDYSPTTHLLTSQTDRLGRTTDYSYYPNGDLESLTELAGTSDAAEYKFTYDPTDNQIASITDPLGHTTTISYDPAAHTETIVDARGEKWQITDNDEGEPIGVTDPEGNTTYLSYLYNDLVAVTNPLGETTSVYRDAVGRPVELTDAEGNVTKYTWTPLDLLASETSPLGSETKYAYDDDGDLISINDGNGNVTKFGYDDIGNVTSETDALGKAETYTYNGDGDVTSFTDRDGHKTTYSYNDLDLLTSVKYGVTTSGDQSSTTLSWDAANRLVSAVDSVAGAYGFKYNGLNDVVSASSPEGTVTYTYNVGGLQTSMSVPHQSTVDYTYDADNDLTKITQGSSVVSMGYNADSLPTSLALPDGVDRTTTYNAASQPTALSFAHGTSDLGAIDYAYTADGLVASETGSLASVVEPAAITRSTYNADNELVARDGTTYTYNGDGNLTSDGTNTYSWNDRGQLSSIAGSSSASFVYDPFGRTQSATGGGSTTSDLYDGLNVVEELSGGTPTADLLTGGLDQVLQLTTASGVSSSVLADQLGSTIGLANASGSIATRYSYTPSGIVSVSGASSPNTFEFAGTQNEGTGLYPIGARYYSPSLGQFVSQDPSGFNGGTTDLYQYAYDNPVNAVDPLGLGNCAHWYDVSCQIGNAWNDTGGPVVNYLQNNTVGICVNGAIQNGITGPGNVLSQSGAEFCLVGNLNGVGYETSTECGPGINDGLGINLQTTTNANPNNLNGNGQVYGGGIKFVNGDIQGNGGGKITGYEGGVGVGLPASFYYGTTHTTFNGFTR